MIITDIAQTVFEVDANLPETWDKVEAIRRKTSSANPETMFLLLLATILKDIIEHNRNGELYLSGPMTGLPDNNFPAFNKAANQLRALGYKVFNPAENGEGDWVELLKKDIPAVCRSSGIILLPGWINSEGARFEFDVARKLKIPSYFIEDFISDKQNAVTI